MLNFFFEGVHWGYLLSELLSVVSWVYLRVFVVSVSSRSVWSERNNHFCHWRFWSFYVRVNFRHEIKKHIGLLPLLRHFILWNFTLHYFLRMPTEKLLTLCNFRSTNLLFKHNLPLNLFDQRMHPRLLSDWNSGSLCVIKILNLMSVRPSILTILLVLLILRSIFKSERVLFRVNVQKLIRRNDLSMQPNFL